MGALFAAVAVPFLSGAAVVARGARLAVVLRLLGSGRLRPEVLPAAGVEASWAMERSLAMRWVRALGVTSVVGRGG